MRIEQNDPSLILSQTTLPDVFFTEYLPQASGDYVNVYLYLFFLSKYNKEIKINDLSKNIELPVKTIQDAIKYWEGIGLLIRKNQGFILANLQEIELNKLYKPKVTMSAEHIKESNESQSRAKAIETINNECFQGVMSPSWYGDIDLWFKKYGFDEQVMIALFRLCFSKATLNHNYVATVAEGWHKNNVQTYSDLDSYFAKTEKLKLMYTSIKKKLRLSRNLNVFEEAFVEKWHITYGYDMQVIDLALKQTVSKYSFSFEYLDKILTNWYQQGLKTTAQIEKYLSENKSHVTKTPSKNTKANFKQRTYTNLNDLYINVNNK